MNRKTNRQGKNYPQTLRSSFSSLEDEDDPMSSMIPGTANRWYDAKHPAQEIDEKKMINSIEVKRCPYCHGTYFRRHGFDRNGIQRYLCLDPACGRTFNPLSRTVFDSHKIPVPQWIEFLVHLFQLQSVSDSSIDNTNARSTGRYWTLKIFRALEGYQEDIMMGSRFYTDETFVPVMPRDLVRKNGRKLAGLSRNVCCIFTATDEEHTVLIANGFGKPSMARTREALESHIRHGSMMVDDGEKSHSVLVRELGLRRESHPTSETRGLSNEDNPMEPINKVHRFFKRFVRNHGGFDRDNLQDWCNLFSFIWNHHGNMPEMVREILVRLTDTHHLMRYREVMRKKSL